MMRIIRITREWPLESVSFPARSGLEHSSHGALGHIVFLGLIYAAIILQGSVWQRYNVQQSSSSQWLYDVSCLLVASNVWCMLSRRRMYCKDHVL